MRRLRNTGQLKNKRGLVGWPIIFIMTIAVVATTITALHFIDAGHAEMTSAAVTDDAMNLLENALVNLPECFAYEGGGGSVVDEEKLLDNDRKNCVSLGTVVWRLELASTAIGGSTGYHVIGNPNFKGLVQKKFTMVVKRKDGTYGKEFATLILGTRGVNFEVEETEDLYYDVKYAAVGSSSAGGGWLYEANIINLTTHEKDCGNLDRNNIYNQHKGDVDWREGNLVNARGFKTVTFTIRTEENITAMEDCGVELKVYPADDRRAYEQAVVKELQ